MFPTPGSSPPLTTDSSLRQTFKLWFIRCRKRAVHGFLSIIRDKGTIYKKSVFLGKSVTVCNELVVFSTLKQSVFCSCCIWNTPLEPEQDLRCTSPPPPRHNALLFAKRIYTGGFSLSTCSFGQFLPPLHHKNQRMCERRTFVVYILFTVLDRLRSFGTFSGDDKTSLWSVTQIPFQPVSPDSSQNSTCRRG